MKKRTLKQMQKMLDVHFHDEWGRILDDINIMRQHGTQSGNQVNIHPTLMSDFLIHFRILHEFFYGKKDKRVCKAKDYIKWNKKESKRIKIWNRRIHEYLAHLSYSRLKRWRPWPIQSLLYPHYRKITIRFIKELPPKYNSRLLGDLKQRLISEVRI